MKKAAFLPLCKRLLGHWGHTSGSVTVGKLLHFCHLRKGTIFIMLEGELQVFV